MDFSNKAVRIYENYDTFRSKGFKAGELVQTKIDANTVAAKITYYDLTARCKDHPLMAQIVTCFVNLV